MKGVEYLIELWELLEKTRKGELLAEQVLVLVLVLSTSVDRIVVCLLVDANRRKLVLAHGETLGRVEVIGASTRHPVLVAGCSRGAELHNPTASVRCQQSFRPGKDPEKREVPSERTREPKGRERPPGERGAHGEKRREERASGCVANRPPAQAKSPRPETRHRPLMAARMAARRASWEVVVMVMVVLVEVEEKEMLEEESVVVVEGEEAEEAVQRVHAGWAQPSSSRY